MRTSRYDPVLVQPMRDELTQIGFEELLTPDDVERVLGAQDGTVLMLVNSVCGCAAGKARPGVRLALEHSVRPDRLPPPFARPGVDATEGGPGPLPRYP